MLRTVKNLSTWWRNARRPFYPPLLDENRPTALSHSQSECRISVHADCKHGNSERKTRQCSFGLSLLFLVISISGWCFSVLVTSFLSFYGAAAASVMGLHRVYSRDVLDWTVSSIVHSCHVAWRFFLLSPSWYTIRSIKKTWVHIL